MAWEDRRRKKYYYRKRRVGDRVVSEYVGGGSVGELAAAVDESKRLAREEERQLFQQERDRQRAIDEAVDRACRLIRHLIYAALLLNDYHMHRGQWRKKR